MKSKTVSETNWKNYLIKAGQFFESAREAFYKENWNAVGLNAVHSAISANDALTVHAKKLRSASENHADSAGLLLEVLGHDDEVREQVKHLTRLINKKNLIEYESRLFYKKEAEEVIQHAERFLEWAKSKLAR